MCYKSITGPRDPYLLFYFPAGGKFENSSYKKQLEQIILYNKAYSTTFTMIISRQSFRMSCEMLLLLFVPWEREKNTPRKAFRFSQRTPSAWTLSTVTLSSAGKRCASWCCRSAGRTVTADGQVHCIIGNKQEFGGHMHTHKPEPFPLATCPYRKRKFLLLQLSLFFCIHQ
jgi:hypothetical protein